MVRVPGFHRGPPHERQHAKIKEISRQDLRFVLPFIARWKGTIVLAILFTGLVSGVGILTPWFTQVLIDDYLLPGDLHGLALVGTLLAFIHLSKWAFSYGQSRTTAEAGQRVVKDVRRAVYEKILALSLRFNNARKKGELLSLVTSDVNALSHAFTVGIISIFSDLVSLVGIVVAMFLISPPLAAISLVVVPLMFGTIMVLRKKIRQAFVEVRRKVAALSATVEENLTGIRVIKALRVERRADQDFMDMSLLNFRTSMKATLLFAVLFAIISLQSFVAFALVIGVGGLLYLEGAITLGGFIAFFQYILMFLQPIRDLLHTYSLFQEASAALLHISEYMQFPVDVPDPAPDVVEALPDPVAGRIELRDVAFSYGRRPFMEDFNVVVTPGEKVGIVGETGAGKSTLVNLITRLYEVDAGGVYIDGVDVRHIPRETFRPLFGVVSQEAFIFPGTIKSNIRFGRPEATDAEIVAAAKAAQAHDFITRTPAGYETVLGEHGAGLSGGQKQLVAYARLLLARPRIAILDEATSNIDGYTETLIQQNLAEILARCTTLIIAHRFKTIEMVDRLVLLKAGRVVTTGTHAELYTRSAYYRDLYDKQYSRY